MVTENNHEKLVEEMHPTLDFINEGLCYSIDSYHDQCLQHRTENTQDRFVVMEH